MSTITHFTADQLLAMPNDGYRYELVAGELRKTSPGGTEHGFVIGQLHTNLGQHIQEKRLGIILGAETGFLLERDPDTVRAPDISFLRAEQILKEGIPTGYWPGPPDLAVEVVSPGDRVGEVEDKVAQWLRSGTGEVWVVSPALRTLTIYRGKEARTFSADDHVKGSHVLPGFQCRLADLFDFKPA